MPQTPSFLQDGIDRVESAVRDAERQGRKVLKRVRREQKKLEKQVEKRRKELTKQAGQLRKQVAKQVESVVGPLPVATKRDLAKVDRKLAELRRQVNALEKSRSRRRAA